MVKAVQDKISLNNIQEQANFEDDLSTK